MYFDNKAKTLMQGWEPTLRLTAPTHLNVGLKSIKFKWGNKRSGPAAFPDLELFSSLKWEDSRWGNQILSAGFGRAKG